MENSTYLAIIQIITTAKELLIREGWCRGQLINSQGERCVLGSLQEALYRHDSSLKYETVTLIQTRLGRRISVWNDDPNMTRMKVISFLTSLISDLEFDLQEKGEFNIK